jgi:hypothetical protein
MASKSVSFDINYVFGLLHSVIVGDVGDDSEVHATSMFIGEVLMLAKT